MSVIFKDKNDPGTVLLGLLLWRMDHAGNPQCGLLQAAPKPRQQSSAIPIQGEKKYGPSNLNKDYEFYENSLELFYSSKIKK